MEPKALFDSALTEVSDRYTFSSDREIINKIRERAKKMEKNKETRHRVFGVAAGVAGAAAVLTGAFFGLKWLNDNGGLKGPDVGGPGAGYHEDAAEPAETTPVTTDALIATEEITEPKDILHSGFDVLEFSDMTATIHKLDYDGQFLRMLVEAEYDEPLSNNQLYLDVKDSAKYDMGEYCLTDHQFILAADYRDIADKIWDEHIGVTPWDDSADIIRTGNKLMYDLGIYIRLDPGQTAEVRFLYFPDSGSADSEYAGNYTLTGIDTTGAFYTASDSATNMTVTVSKWGALIESPYDYGAEDNFSVKVKYKDGTEQILADRDVKFKSVIASDEIPFYEFPSYYYTRGQGRNYLMQSAFRGEKIDIENIAAVVINGEEISDMEGKGDTTNTVDALSQIAGIYGPGEEPYEVVESEETSENTTNTNLPEFPIAISNGNGFYGEYLETPLTGDDAWELVKERGGIDFDYNLPYDKSLFTFTGAAFVIDYADCDVTANVGGMVEYAGWYQGWGQTVLLHDENGHYWLYGHLGEISVAEGDKVESGEKIGHTGTSGLTDRQLFAMRVG